MPQFGTALVLQNFSLIVLESLMYSRRRMLQRWMDSIDLKRGRKGLDFPKFYCFRLWSVARSILRTAKFTFLCVTTTTLLADTYMEDN